MQTETSNESVYLGNQEDVVFVVNTWIPNLLDE